MPVFRLTSIKALLGTCLSLSISACDSGIQIQVPIADYTVTEEVPKAYRPGETVTIRGSGFTKNHWVVIDSILYPIELISSEEIRFTMPNNVGNGKIQIATKRRAIEKQVPNIFALAANDYPLFTGDPAKLCVDEKFYNASGELQEGTKDCTKNSLAGLAPCSADGEVGCETNASFKAALVIGAENKILSGQTLAGIPGNITLPAVGKVLTGTGFGVAGTGSSGTLILPLGSNVRTGSGTYGDPGAAITPSYSPDFPSAANVLNTDTVDNLAGTLTLPAAGKVFTGTSFGVAGTGSSGALTLPLETNVKTGSGTYGDPGAVRTPSYSPDFPSAANVLNTDTVDNLAGTLTLPAAGKVFTGTAFGVAGTGSSGTLTLPAPAYVRTLAGNFGVDGSDSVPTISDCADAGSGCFVVGPNMQAAATSANTGDKILLGQSVAGIEGNVSLPVPGDVYSGIAYGVRSTTVGTLTLPTANNVRASQGDFGRGGNSISPDLKDCVADGAIDCVAVTAFKAADMTQAVPGNIKLGAEIAGIPGDYPSATHRLANNTGLPDLASFGPTTPIANYEFFDSIGNVYSATIADGSLVTPSTTQQTVNAAAGTLYRSFSVAGDADLVSDNIKNNIDIFGVGGNITPKPDDCSTGGASGCVTTATYKSMNLSAIGANSSSSITASNFNTQIASAGNFEFWDATGSRHQLAGDTDLRAGNIKSTVDIFGTLGSLTLPLATNVLQGTAAYGDPSALLTPSLDSSVIKIRPASPTLTSTAFNLSPDRVTLTWGAVSGASGYIVLMRSGSAVTWTPSDFNSYSTGTYGSDTLIYAGTGTTVNYNTDVTVGITYHFAVYSYIDNNIYSYLPTTSSLTSCAGLAGSWVAVPGDSTYGTNAFCVMKYEAKNVDGVATSQAASLPWTTITQTNAMAACSSLGAGVHLITNNEWMTLATNMANVASNWSGDTVGSGAMNRGNSNYSAACAASTDDSYAYLSGCTATNTGIWANKRTHTLSTGAVVWDLAGNVWDWTSYVISNNNAKPYVSTDGTPQNAWRELSAINAGFTAMTLHDLRPINSEKIFWSESWNSNQGIGQYNAGSNGSGGALLRGGLWNGGANAGVFAAGLNDSP